MSKQIVFFLWFLFESAKMAVILSHPIFGTEFDTITTAKEIATINR